MTKERYSVLIALFALFVLCPAKSIAQNMPPIADAGLSRYAAYDPIVLDATGSYDPDSSGPLSYAWRQTAGPPVVIIDANTATPTIGGSMEPSSGRDPTPKIGGFIQTDEIQECEFELIVSDGELTSLPDTVKIIIVPDFGESVLRLENDSFDPNKPTHIYFGGGDCTIGYPGQYISHPDWLSRANVIDFPHGYTPDSGGGTRTYYKYGDMIIVYLSRVAPEYKQPIQTSGWSTGGQPAIDVGIRLNLSYRDPRYAVNRVTFFDATGYCRDYSETINIFLTSSVDGEQCWVDNYVSTLPGAHPALLYPTFHANVLNVGFDKSTDSSLPWIEIHSLAPDWYFNSLTDSDMNLFNNGVVAGAYWSVVGPGKNLQLASTAGTQTYKFKWYGWDSSGYMDFYDEAQYPGRLPEPVTLVGPADGALVNANGAVLSCEESQNAVGYELLLGSDRHRVMDYNIVSDTPTPPTEIITTFPFDETWWTIRARDQYGSTIYADPMRVDLENLPWPTIENITTGQKYGYIQVAINNAVFGDEIVLREGTYYENIYFKGKNLTVRSTDPNDPAVVAATVINGGDHGSVVTVSGTEETDCVLAGLTIIGGTVGVSCRAGSLTIRNCTIGSNGPIAIEFWEGYEPRIIDCTVLGYVHDRRLLAHWTLDETEGSIAYDSIGDNDGTVHGNPLWQPTGGQIDGALAFDGTDDYLSTDFVLNPMDGAFSVFAWIKGGAPGQVIISQTAGTRGAGSSWLCTDPSEGKLMAGLTHALLPLKSESVITDDQWHDIGLVYDGSSKYLYVDGAEVAKDNLRPLLGTDGGLYFGADKNLEPGSFFSGLIDDVRIYDRAITP